MTRKEVIPLPIAVVSSFCSFNLTVKIDTTYSLWKHTYHLSVHRCVMQQTPSQTVGVCRCSQFKGNKLEGKTKENGEKWWSRRKKGRGVWSWSDTAVREKRWAEDSTDRQTVTTRQTNPCHDCRNLPECSEVPAAWTGWTMCSSPLPALTPRPNSSGRQGGTTCFLRFSLAKVSMQNCKGFWWTLYWK